MLKLNIWLINKKELQQHYACYSHAGTLELLFFCDREPGSSITIALPRVPRLCLESGSADS